MMTAAASLNDARTMVGALVHAAERSTGSRMLAYETIATQIGASSSWLRKLIGNQPVQLLSHVHDNIRSLHAEYAARCARLEQQAEEKRVLFFALRGSRDAFHQSVADGQGVGSRDPSAQSGASPAVVATMVVEGRE